MMPSQKELKILDTGPFNTSPTDSLPVEILATVFMHHLRSVVDGGQRRWPVILHVCQRWREVATSCATLWRDISTDNPDLLDFMLHHSRGLFVNISAIRIVQDQNPRLEDKIIGHVARIGRLELDLVPSGSPQVRKWISQLLDSVIAPDLHTLTFRVEHHTYPNTLFVAPLSLSPLATRSLTLVNVRIQFSQPVQPNITYLDLTTSDPRPAEWKTLSVLDTLSCCPNLVHLRLHDLAFQTTNSADPEDPVALPRLETFAFYGAATGYLLLTRRLLMSPQADLDVAICTMASPDDVEIRHIYAGLSAHLKRRGAALPCIPHYEVRFSNHNEKIVPGTMQGPHHGLDIHQLSTPEDPYSPDHLILKFRLTFSTAFGLRSGYHAYLPLSYLADDSSEVHIQGLELHSNLVYLETERLSEGINSDGTVSDGFKFLTWPGIRSLSLADPCTTSWMLPYIGFRQVFPGLERLVIKNLNPWCDIEWFDIDEVASMLKETMFGLRRVIESRTEATKRQLRELCFLSSCVPESWKAVEGSRYWASERVSFDDECWESYWTTPFDTTPTLNDYLHSVMDPSPDESSDSYYTISENELGEVEVRVESSVTDG